MYYMGGGTAETNPSDDEPEDPKQILTIPSSDLQIIITNINLELDSGKYLSDGEAAVKAVRKFGGIASLSDEFESRVVSQPRGNFMQASTSDDSPGTLRMAWEFFTANGPRHRDFGPNAAMTKNMMTSPDVAVHRQNFVHQGGGVYGPTSVQFGWAAKDGPVTSFINGPLENGPRQFVGTFTITIKEGSNGDAYFTLQNTTSLKSFLYHMPGVQNVDRSELAPLSNKTQEFYWCEKGLIKH
jgi:hypothetical protein